MPPHTLAERLVAARERLGWSQEDAAGRLGLKPPQLSKWERGANTPGGRNLARIAEAYGLSVAELLGESTNGTPHPLGDPRPEEGVITLSPRAYYFALGILDAEQRHIKGVSETIQGVNDSLAALRRMLEQSVSGIARAREELPIRPRRVEEWEYIPEPPTAVDPANGE
jgi:transcriptional regulator with XRE-family HTH domain